MLKMYQKLNDQYFEARDTSHPISLWIYQFRDIVLLVLTNGTDRNVIPSQEKHRDPW